MITRQERMKNLRFNIKKVEEEISVYEGGHDNDKELYEYNIESLRTMRQNLANLESIVYGTGALLVSLTREEMKLLWSITHASMMSGLKYEKVDNLKKILELLDKALQL